MSRIANLGLGLATTAATVFGTGCNKTEIVAPGPVNPPTSQTAKERFTAFADSAGFGSVGDTLYVKDSRTGSYNGYKVDVKNSTNDTMVLKQTVLDASGVPQDYLVNKVYKDGTGLSAKIYDSHNFKYNDTKWDFLKTTHFEIAKGTDGKYGLIESQSTLGNLFRYLKSATSSIVNVENLKYGGKSTITKLFVR